LNYARLATAMALCSFECVIDFAVKRIRQRRE